ncbi:MAG: VCBS repeat-containing protein [Verrucomicrobiota bacterium]
MRRSCVKPKISACEDLALADLNGDGRLDIIAAGRATKNLKVYFNER